MMNNHSYQVVGSYFRGTVYGVESFEKPCSFWFKWKCILPRVSQGFISKPRIGNEMWEEILELNRGSWRKRLRWIVKTSGNTSIIENLIPLRSFLHFSQLQEVKINIWITFNITLTYVCFQDYLYMLSPFSSSALKNADKQSWRRPLGPQNQPQR